MAHLDDATLLAHFAGGLDEAQQQQVLREIDECALCADLAIAVAGTLAPAHREAVGTVIAGRYRIERELGRGGMGVVYRALDTVIERHVALKLVEHGNGGAEPMRELKTLGQLVHPAIVRIYDAGVDGEQVFVAMQEVTGQRLRDWTQQRRATTSDLQHAVLRIFAVLAGAVAYAHDQGVLHRDIKSSNVLIDDAQQPWLIDFGLASSLQSEGEGPRVAGTPTHFAPEIIDGGVATAQSDQFAFFVTMIEALTGVRPFPGDSVATIRAAMKATSDAPAMWQRGLPQALRAVLTRGLALDPAARFASMHAVQQAIVALYAPAAQAHGLSRWRVAAFGAVAIIIGGGAWWRLSATASPTTSHDVTCDASTATLDLGVHAAVATRLRELPPAARDLWREWSQAWQATGAALCADFTARRISATQLTQRQLCLRSAVRQLVSRVSAQDPASIVDNLPSAEQCTSDAVTLDDVALPANVSADDVLALRDALAAIEIRSDHDDGAAVLAAQASLLERIRALGYAPLLAEALNQRAAIAEGAGDMVAARAAVNEALEVATRSNNRAALARSHYINTIVLNDLGASTETDRSLGLARAAATEQPDAMQWRIELAAQTIAIHRGRSADAIAPLRALLRDCLAAKPSQPVLCIDIHQALIAALFDARRRDELMAELPLLDATITTHLGRNNQRYAVFLANQIGVGSLEEAAAKGEAALAILQTMSPKHPKLIPLLQNLGMIATNQGDNKRGLQYMQRALTAARDRFGSNSAAVAHLEVNIATSLLNLDDNDGALALLVHAEQVMANVAGGEASPFLAAARSMLAELYAGRDQLDAAYQLLVPLVASQQKPEADPAQRGRDEFLLAQVAWSRGERDEAVRNAKLAVQDLSDTKAFPTTLKQARAWLADPKQR